MAWFGLRWGRRRVEQDPRLRQELLREVRERFGTHVPAPFAEQAGGVARMLDGDDGLAAAAEILREFADSAYAAVVAQGFAVDRRSYRPLWAAAGARLRWPLFALGCGLQPYIQVAGAVMALGTGARQAVRVTDPRPLLTHLFEVLDLVTVGWEFGRVRVDADAANLAGGLISTAKELRAAMGDPPPLPDPVREMMRRNHTVDVLDPTGTRVIGGFNPGRTMREALLA